MGADRTAALAGCLEAMKGLVSVYLFGSEAEGRSHRQSDLDVGILLSHAAYPTAAARFEARLLAARRVTAATGREADIVVLNDAPPPLARAILTRGRRVLCRDREADHAFLRTTLSRAADLQPFLERSRRTKLAAIVR